MPARIARRVLVLASVMVLLTVASTQATHSPTVGDVVTAAVSLQMECEPPTSEVRCTGGIYYFNEPLALIRPGNGPLHDLVTQTNAHSNGVLDFLPEDRGWMANLHSVGCSDSRTEAGAVMAFMDQVAAALEQQEGTGPFSYGPLAVGECTMTGRLFLPSPTAFWRYEITSLPTGAFPTPTPAPTPARTPPPTATPTATPTPSPTPTPTPSPTPSESASASASESASEEPSASPEGTVGGIVFTPEPSAAAPDPAPADGDSWTESVHDAADVSTDPAALASSALFAFLLLVVMGFIGELFNNTVKVHHDVIAGWWSNSRLGRLASAWSSLWKGGP